MMQGTRNEETTGVNRRLEVNVVEVRRLELLTPYMRKRAKRKNANKLE